MRVIKIPGYLAGLIAGLDTGGAGHGTGSVTEHNDMSSAGSGAIITSAERTAIGTNTSAAAAALAAAAAAQADADAAQTAASTAVADAAAAQATADGAAATVVTIQADDWVTTDRLAANAVTTAKILDNQVTGDKLAPLAALQNLGPNSLNPNVLADPASVGSMVGRLDATAGPQAVEYFTVNSLTALTSPAGTDRVLGATSAGELRGITRAALAGAQTYTFGGAVPVVVGTGTELWRAPQNLTVTAFRSTPADTVVSGGTATVAIAGGGNNLLDAATKDITGGTVGTAVPHDLTATGADLELDAGDLVEVTVVFGSGASGGSQLFDLQWVPR